MAHKLTGRTAWRSAALPKPEERAAAIHLIEQHGLAIFCRALFNANEFVYVM